MKLFKYFIVILLCLGSFSTVFGEDGFHSEFGYLPPEIPADSGLTAGQLNELISRIDEETLPPSHRLRRLYEWMMTQYHFVTDDSCTGEDQEAVSACLIGIVQSSEAGDSGFALLSHYLLEKMGFPSVIISGKLTLPDGQTEEHRWNYVYYSEKWYHFDPLGEIKNADLNGFMNVQKDLAGGPLQWDRDSIPESAQYAVKAIGCSCSF